MEKTIRIKNATKLGYLIAKEGDGIDLQFPSSTKRRGRVQPQMIQTLDCSGGGSKGVVVEDMRLYSKCKRLEKLVNNTEFVEGEVMNLDLYNQTTNKEVSQTLTEPNHNTQRLFDGLRIRKLTPKECWRLMGFKDDEFEEAQKVNSNAQLYKQAGNSIVVDVLVNIFDKLLSDYKE